MIKVTRVKVDKVEIENSRVKGYANITLNDSIAIKGIRIIQGDHEMFIAMPSRKNSVGKFDDIVFPVNQEARDILTEAIINEYNSVEEDVVEQE